MNPNPNRGGTFAVDPHGRLAADSPTEPPSAPTTEPPAAPPAKPAAPKAAAPKSTGKKK